MPVLYSCILCDVHCTVEFFYVKIKQCTQEEYDLMSSKSIIPPGCGENFVAFKPHTIHPCFISCSGVRWKQIKISYR